MNAHTRSSECPLTRSQITFVQWLADGKSAQEIADIEGLAQRTVQNSITKALVAARVAKSTALVATAIRKGWIS